MTDMVEFDVFIVIDSAGDYAVGADEDSALERFAEEIGGDCARVVRRIRVKAPKPAVSNAGSITLPELPAEGELELEAP